jgi:nitrous oxide reductase accessory protein NosL
MKAIAVVFVALLAAGCSSASPLPIHVGDLCFNCRRPINDVNMAGQVITQTNQALKFRTSACMARYLKANPDLAKVVYVTDYKTGRFVKASSATFVPFVTVERYVKTTDYVAYYSKDVAAEFAKERDSTLIGWDEVLRRAE